MSKHRAPRPSLFERPETYLHAAVFLSGVAVGAISASLPLTLLTAVVVFVPLAVLAVLPAPRERSAAARRTPSPAARAVLPARRRASSSRSLLRTAWR